MEQAEIPLVRFPLPHCEYLSKLSLITTLKFLGVKSSQDPDNTF